MQKMFTLEKQKSDKIEVINKIEVTKVMDYYKLVWYGW
jgi:hypothetical protein